MPDSKNLSSGTLSRENMLKFLNRSTSYPHRPESIKLLQTHASYVAIVPPYVYKLKKPVDLGFMDFTTISKRKRNAEREVKLNRRLAPEVYLGIIPLIRSADGIRFAEDGDEAKGEVIDYAVKMKALEPDFFFKTMLRKGEIHSRHIHAIADTLIPFYQNQDPGPEILKHGTEDSIREKTQGNFTTLAEYIDETIEQPAFDGIKYYTDRFFECNSFLFQQRIQDKKIVDGHGDLHLEHIHLHPERLSIFDCVEFSDAYRYTDMAGDTAFLAMDLDYHGRQDLAHYFLELMEERLGDQDHVRLAEFYKVYRACVRGKVDSIKSEGQEVLKEDREKSKESAIRHMQLALRYVLAGSGPLILIVMGNIATGKSTLAGKLEHITGWPRLNSDVVRKEKAGLSPHRPAPENSKAHLYSAENTHKIYNYLKKQAIERGLQNKGLIIDATYGKSEERQAIWDELTDNHIPFCFIEITADEKTIRSRLEKRAFDPHQPSDARLKDFEKLYKNYQPPEDIDVKHYIQVNSNLAETDNLSRILKSLVDKRL